MEHQFGNPPLRSAFDWEIEDIGSLLERIGGFQVDPTSSDWRSWAASRNGSYSVTPLCRLVRFGCWTTHPLETNLGQFKPPKSTILLVDSCPWKDLYC